MGDSIGYELVDLVDVVTSIDLHPAWAHVGDLLSPACAVHAAVPWPSSLDAAVFHGRADRRPTTA
jgi:hypothetical protein